MSPRSKDIVGSYVLVTKLLLYIGFGPYSLHDNPLTYDWLFTVINGKISIIH